MLTPTQIQNYITAGLDCQYCEVIGDGSHFFAKIVSQAFDGRRSLDRHRLVYQVLGDKMADEIHALSIEAFCPNEWLDRFA